MATVFWDSSGIIMIDYLEKGKTITGTYYADLLDHFKAQLLDKRPRLAHKKFCFIRQCPVTHIGSRNGKIAWIAVWIGPSCTLLAPCDFFLFPNVKKWLAGKKFGTNEEVIDDVNEYFTDPEKTYFLEKMKKLDNRWTKRVALKRDYVEK